MADTAGYPTDGKLDAHNVHTNNKRKRDTRDQGLNRPAPHTANNDLTDQATASFLAAHNAADDDMQQQFDVHHNGGTNTASVGDTAAAALAYHQMTVPQATELQFQTQNSGDGSFSMGDHNQQQTGMQDFSLEALKAATQTGRPGQTAPSDSPPQSATHKPQVGTEEWHKVRRDNHKEGRHLYTCLKQQSLTDTQSNAAAARLSTKALTNSPRSFQAAKRTRDLFCNEQCSSLLNSRRTSNKISRNGRSRSYSPSKPSPSSARVATSSKPNANGHGTSARSTSAHAKTTASCPTRSKSVRRTANRRERILCRARKKRHLTSG
ncbi:hypothetical protein IG631_13107 [Alternaria alternata]|nr:hypothetical protein IG631_13107 [Alternaria alternata]